MRTHNINNCSDEEKFDAREHKEGNMERLVSMHSIFEVFTILLIILLVH